MLPPYSWRHKEVRPSPSLVDKERGENGVYSRYRREAMSEIRKRYSPDFKVEVVRLLEASRRSASQLEREAGIARGNLSRWKREFAANGDEAFPGYGRLTAKQEQRRQLERENEGCKLVGAYLATRGTYRDAAELMSWMPGERVTRTRVQRLVWEVGERLREAEGKERERVFCRGSPWRAPPTARR